MPCDDSNPNTVSDTCTNGTCRGAASGAASSTAAPASLTNCNGQMVDLTCNSQYCGSCAIACDFPNATALCTRGVCTLGACATHYADADGRASNGCEVDLMSNASNCGAVRNVCPQAEPHAPSITCAYGQCMVRTCDAGWYDLDGQYVNGCEANHPSR